MFENPWTEGQSLLPHQIVLQPSNSPSGLPLWIVLVLLLEVLSLDVNSGEQGPVPTFKINSVCPGVFPPYFVHNYIKKIPLEQCFHTKLQPQLFCSHLVIEAHWISPAAGGRVSWGCWMPKAATAGSSLQLERGRIRVGHERSGRNLLLVLCLGGLLIPRCCWSLSLNPLKWIFTSPALLGNVQFLLI